MRTITGTKPFILSMTSALALVLSCATATAQENGVVSGLSDDTLMPPIRYIGPSSAWESPHFEAGNMMIAEWEALGLAVTQELVPDPQVLGALMQQQDFDVIAHGYIGTLDRLDPDQLLSRILLCDFAVDGGSNRGRYCFEPYENAVLTQKRETDADARMALVHEAQQIQALDIPWITVYHPSEDYVWNCSAYEDVVPAAGMGLYNFWNEVDARPITEDASYRMAIQGDFRSINPMVPDTIDGDVEHHRLIWDTLGRVNPEGEVVPWAAESWEFADETTINVKLRDDLMFHDGVPVTASDVKFSFDFIKEWQVGLYINPLNDIASVEVVDDFNLVIHLVAPSSSIFFGAISQILILPEHQWADVVETQGLAHPRDWAETNLVGSGPYMISAVTREAVELVANTDHFHPPASDRIVTIAVADQQAVFRALQDGTAYFHQVASLTPAGADAATTMDNLCTGKTSGITIRGMAFSFEEDSPTRDFALRAAMAHLIDYETIVDVILRGYGDAGESTIAPGNVTWHDNTIEWSDELGDDVPHYRSYNPEVARQILIDAGYRWDEQGRLHYPENYAPRIHYND